MITEIVSAGLILAITILFLNPGDITMPDTLVSMLTLTLIVAFLIFSAYILKEKSADEREALHILAAGRISYLVGVGTLVLAIIIQGLSHEIDPWLVIVLCIMVLAKLLSRIYTSFRM